MNRREFLKVSGLTALGIGISPLVCGRRLLAGGPSRPNILLVTTDQQAGIAMSCAGNPYLNTSNMDAIAADGVQFTRAYTPDPVCVPARCTMYTGMMPHATGMYLNNPNPYSGRIASKGWVTLGKRMWDAGYITGYYGKWHLPIDKTDVTTHGFMFWDHLSANDVDTKIEEHLEAFIIDNDNSENPSGWPWFLVASFVNPHDACEFAKLPASAHINDHPSNPIPEPVFENPPYYPVSNCPPLPANHEIPANEPPAIRFVQQVEPDTARNYPSMNPAAAGDPSMPGPDPITPWPPWTENAWRFYLYGYYRMCEDVDARIGTLLTALDNTGQRENTVIIFTSDHGDGIAAHKWQQKQILYEESARIPFLVAQRGTTLTGYTDDEHLISMGEDIYATCCDYAETTLPTYTDLQLYGRSVKALAEGDYSGPWRDNVVVETHFNRMSNSYKIHGRAVVGDRYKYMVYYDVLDRFDHNAPGNREQLFDLENDPGEMNDLAGNSEYRTVLNDMRWRFKNWCIERNDKIEDGYNGPFPYIEPDMEDFPADMNKDGVVDFKDFVRFAEKKRKQ